MKIYSFIRGKSKRGWSNHHVNLSSCRQWKCHAMLVAVAGCCPSVRPCTVQVGSRVRLPRFQVGFADSPLGTDYNWTTISCNQETGSTPSAASMLWHHFSAFWLSSLGRIRRVLFYFFFFNFFTDFCFVCE